MIPLWAPLCLGVVAAIAVPSRDEAVTLVQISHAIDHSHMDDIRSTLPVTRFWGNARFNVNGKSPPVPKFYLQFDWMFSEPLRWTTTHDSRKCRQAWHDIRSPREACASGKRIRNPHTVWVQPKIQTVENTGYLDGLLDKLERFQVPYEGDRILVVAGDDQLLSKVRDGIEKLQPWFRRVYYYGMDINMPGVYAMPTGLSELYLRKKPVESLANVVSDPSPVKTGEVLGAFGAYFPSLDEKIPSREEARQFCSLWNGAPWLHCGLVAEEKWYKKLAKYKFLLNPDGNGVQSSKWLEALISGTIPICQRNAATDSLLESGWPMVVVDDWAEVARKDNRDRWWKEISPRLEEMRARGAFTTEGFMRYLTASPASGQRGGNHSTQLLERSRSRLEADIPRADDAMRPVAFASEQEQYRHIFHSPLAH